MNSSIAKRANRSSNRSGGNMRCLLRVPGTSVRILVRLGILLEDLD